jgi:trimeric autotransporter adhesin
MATLAELAELIGVVKADSNGGNASVPAGWIRIPGPDGIKQDPIVDFFSEAFKNPTTGEIVISTTGPVPGLLTNNGVLPTWLQIAFKEKTPDEADAIAFATQIARENPGATIVEAGYSRGGADAQAAVATLTNNGNTQISGVTFQAPGVAPDFFQSGTTYNVLNLYNQGDWVQAAGGAHVGVSFAIPAGPSPSKELGDFIETLAAGTLALGPASGLLLGVFVGAKEVGTAHLIDTSIAYLNSHPALGGLTAQQFLALPSNQRDQLTQGGTVDNSAQIVGNPNGTVVLSDVNNSIAVQPVSDRSLTETFVLNNGRDPQTFEYDVTVDTNGKAAFSGPSDTALNSNQLQAKSTLDGQGLDAKTEAQQLVAYDLGLVKTEEELSAIFDDQSLSQQDQATDKAFLKQDFGQALADANADNTNPVPLTHPSVFGDTKLDFATYNAYESALASADKNPQYASLRPAIDQALAVVDQAGEEPVLEQSTSMPSDPFADPSFDPTTATPVSEEIKDYGTAGYTLFLPYAAGVGGQKVQIQLSGTYAGLSVQVGNQIFTPNDGTFDLTVKQGDQRASFLLIAEGDVTSTEQVGINATLVDANDIPTGQTHLEANLTVDAKNPDFVTVKDIVANPDSGDFDTLSAGGESDHIIGSGLHDLILGGTFDVIEGGGGNDIISGGVGQAQIYAQNKVDIADAIDNPASATGKIGSWIDGGTGDADLDINDLSPGGDGPIFAGNDTIIGDGNNDALNGGGGDDLIIAGNGDNYIAAHSDEMAEPTYDSEGEIINFNWTVTRSFDQTTDQATYEPSPVFGDPNYFNNGSDTIYAGSGDNVIFTQNGDNFVKVGDGNNLIVGGSGDDTLVAGNGNDTILGDFTDNPLPDDGSDYIAVGNGNDLIRGAGGDNTIIVGTGNDFIVGRDGNDYIEVVGGQGADFINADLGEDTLNEGAGNNTIIGADGTETIVAGDGNNEVDVGNGQDSIGLGDGDNTITAGGGGDFIQIGTGSNYVEVGDGNDSINAGLDSGGGGATVGDDTIFAGDGFDTIQAGSGNNYIEVGNGSDLINSKFDGNNTIFAGDGNDSVEVGNGDNYIEVGNGDDSINAGSGNNTIIAGDGSDTIFADSIVGGAGNDYVELGNGLDAVSGGEGNDTFVAGGGNDFMDGMGGDNTYVFNAGHGNALIASGSGTNTLQFGDDLPSDLTLSPILGEDGTPSLYIQDADGYVIVDGGLTGNVSNVELADGSVLTLDQLMAQANMQSATVRGPNGNLVFNFTDGGGQSLAGGFGSDTVVGFGGNDTLTSGAGGGLLVGGSGDDTFVVNNPNEQVIEVSDQGTSTLYSSVDYMLPENVQNLTLTGFGNLTGAGNDQDDVITANAGNDTLIAGSGDNTLIGGAGGDTFVAEAGNNLIEAGSGNNTYVFDASSSLNTIQGAHGDTVELLDGTSLDGVVATQGADGTSLVLDFNGAEVTIDNGLEGAVSQFQMADGTTLGLSDFLNATQFDPITVTGDMNGAPVALYTGSGDDTLVAGTGNDTLYAGSGNDLLVGGPGSDLLVGGAGQDTFSFGNNAGSSTIEQNNAGTDYLEFGPGVSLADLTATRLGNDLMVQAANSQTQVTIQNYFGPNRPSTTWQVIGADGTTTPLANILPSAGTGSIIPDATAAETDFLARIRAAFNSGMIRAGYQLGADGDFHKALPDSPGDVFGNEIVYTHVTDNATFQVSSTSSDADPSFVRFYNGVVDESGSQSITYTKVPFVQASEGSGSSSPYFISYADLANGPVTVGGTTIGGSAGTQLPPGSVVVFGTDPTTGQSGPIGIMLPAQNGGGGGVSGISESLRADQYYSNTDIFNVAKLTAGPDVTTIGFAFSMDPWNIINGTAGGDELIDVSNEATGEIADFVGPSGPLLAGPGAIGSLLEAGTGSDTLIGGASDDVLIAGPGNDLLEGGGGNDTYLLFDGNATATVFDAGQAQPGVARDNVIQLPGDVLPGDVTASWSKSIQENPRLVDEALVVPFGDGAFTPILPTYSLYAQLQIGWGTPGSLTVIVPHGEQDAGTGIDYVLFGNGTELPFTQVMAMATNAQDLNPQDHGNVINVADGGDFAYADGPGDDQMTAGDGNDTLLGGGGHDTLIGGSGNDLMVGSGGGSGTGQGFSVIAGGQMYFQNAQTPYGGGVIYGTMWGGQGSTFIAGTGNDTFVGSAAADTFEFSRGDGNVAVTDLYHDPLFMQLATDPSSIDNLTSPELYPVLDEHPEQIADNSDTLKFGLGIRSADVVARAGFFGNALEFDVAASSTEPGGVVSFTDWFGNQNDQLRRVEFDDGTVWTLDNIDGRVLTPYQYTPGDGNQVLSDPSVASGIQFNDSSANVSITRDGIDLLLTDVDGADQLRIQNWFAHPGETPSTQVGFSDGTLLDGVSVTADALTFGDNTGNQVLTAYDGFDNNIYNNTAYSDAIYGGTGNDTLGGGGAKGLLEGGSGNDVLGTGVGPDFVAGGQGDDQIYTGSGYDVVAFNAGDGQDVVGFSGGTLSFGGGITAQQLTLVQDGNDLVIDAGGGDGIRLSGWYNQGSASEPQATLQVIAPGVVQSYDLNAVIATFDQMQAADASITRWSPGASWSDYANVTDSATAMGGPLAYQYAIAGSTSAVSSSTVLNVLNDPAFGVSAQSISFEGYETNPPTNVYNYAAGSGLQTLGDIVGIDTVAFGPGITSDMITLGLDSLVLRIGNAGDQLELTDFNPNDALGTHNISNFIFADGTTLTYAQLLARGFDIYGTTGDETLTGTNLDNRIHAGTGNDVLVGSGAHDTLYGGAGDDTLVAGAGTDLLVGGSGQNTFVLKLGDGQATIVDSANAGGDTVRFGAGITAADVSFTQQGADVVLNYGQTDSVLIKNFDLGGVSGPAPITQYQFTDGSSLAYQNDGRGDYGFTATDSQGNVASTVSHSANADGSSVTSTYNASTGVYGTDYVNADGSFTDYLTTYDSGGGYHQTWTASNGSSGENDKLDDGSTLTRTVNADGSSVTSTFTAGTGVYGTDYVNADGSFTDYLTTYDGGGGYQQSWTASNGTSGENDKSDDGSTLTRTVNADGSSVSSTFTASTGVYGTDYLNADGSFTDYLTTYDGAGGYNQSWTASNGSSGENDKSDDGSTLTRTVNADGSSVTSTYTAGTGVYGTDYVNASGSFTDYLTTYDSAGGYQQSWTASNGTSGENDKLDDGSTLTRTVNADGSSVTSTFTASSGVYGTDYVNADGSYTDYLTTYDSGGGYHQSWTASNGTSGENDKADDGSTLTRTVNADSSSVTSTFSASSGVYGTDYVNADGSFTDYLTTYDGSGGYQQSWTASNGTSGENDKSDDGSTLTRTVNADSSSVTSTFTASTGVYGTDYVNADASYTDYLTKYDGSGGYEQSWTRSDGSGGSITVNGSGTVVGDSSLSASGLQGVDAGGNHLALGTSGADSLGGGSGAELLIGGASNDLITEGAGANVVAFNLGDGQDTVVAGAGQGAVVSLGGNFTYGGLAFQKNVNDLVLDVGGSDSLTFKDWYAGNQNIANLQVIAAAMSDYAPGSGDVLRNAAVETFNFQTLVGEFDQAQAANPALTSWGLTNALLDAHLAGSDSAALGGDLAYDYGVQGNLTGFSVAAAESTLSNAQFGTAPQALTSAGSAPDVARLK